MHTVDTLLALLANLHAANNAPLSVPNDEAFAAFDAANDAIWDAAPAWFTDALKANNHDLANPLVIDPCDWSPDAMCELQIMLAIGSLSELDVILGALAMYHNTSTDDDESFDLASSNLCDLAPAWFWNLDLPGWDPDARAECIATIAIGSL